MSFYGPPTAASISFIKTYTIAYQTENLAVIPYNELTYPSVPHSTVSDDLELSKLWADNMEKLNADIDVYLWDKSVPGYSYTATGHTLEGYTFPITITSNTTATGVNVGLNSYYYKVSGASSGLVTSGANAIDNTTITVKYGTTAAAQTVGLNSLSFSPRTQYVIVKKSDISLVAKAPPPPAAVKVEQPELIDGITRGACLEKFIQMQRGDVKIPLTKRQIEVARMEWSLELKRLSGEAKAKDVNQVMVDIDSDD